MEPRDLPGAVSDVQIKPATGHPGPAVAADPAPAVESGLRRIARGDLLRVTLVVLALTVGLRLPAFFVDVFNSDETFIATQAQVVRDGGDLYREAADRKPPLVPYLYAATFEVIGTTALWSVRVVAMLTAATTAVLLAAEALLVAKGEVKAGDSIVLTIGEPMGKPGGTNTMKIVRVGEHRS